MHLSYRPRQRSTARKSGETDALLYSKPPHALKSATTLQPQQQGALRGRIARVKGSERERERERERGAAHRTYIKMRRRRRRRKKTKQTKR